MERLRQRLGPALGIAMLLTVIPGFIMYGCLSAGFNRASVTSRTGLALGAGAVAAALSTVRADIEGVGGGAIQVVADVTRFIEIEAMRRQIEGELGPIDILVANAGGSFTHPGPLEATSEAGWHASLDGNLTATFLTIKSILPGMKERKAGTIMTISSNPRSPEARAR